MDYIIFRAINDLAGVSPLLDGIGQFLAVMGIFVLALMVLLAHSHRLRGILEGACAAIIALGVNTGIGIIAFRYRPFIAHEQVHLLIEKSGLDKSFPSDHTSLAFALATILYMNNRKWGIAAYVLALFIGIGRIYVGVHYPTDILGCIVVGTLSGVLVWYGGKRLLSHKKFK